MRTAFSGARRCQNASAIQALRAFGEITYPTSALTRLVDLGGSQEQ
jgi:hypothetical protein